MSIQTGKFMIKTRCSLGNTRSGFTLIELMIALTLGLIITGVIVQVFTSTRSTNDLETGLSEVQEQGRFAMEFLAKDIRMAGNFGCAKLKKTAINNIVKTPDGPRGLLSDPYNNAATQPVGLAVFGYTGGGGTALTDWTPQLPALGFFDGLVAPGPELVPFSDVLLVQFATPLNVQLFNTGAPTKANLQLVRTPSTTGAFKQNDVVFISDCRRGDMFRITNNPATGGGTNITLTHGTSGNTQSLLNGSYDSTADVMKLATRAYFIGVNSNPVPPLPAGTTPEPALYRLALDNNDWRPEPLVTGIEQLKFLMGLEAVSADNSNRDMAETYMTANALYNPGTFDPSTDRDMSKVIDVKVAFIARSSSMIDVQNVKGNVVIAEANIPIFGNPNEIYRATPAPPPGSFDPELYRRRRLFTSTVQRRN